MSDTIPLETLEVPSGTQVFDWEIPEEWDIKTRCILKIHLGKR